MSTLKLVLLIAALVVFIIDALWSPAPPRVKLQSVGLALLTGSFLI